MEHQVLLIKLFTEFTIFGFHYRRQVGDDWLIPLRAHCDTEKNKKKTSISNIKLDKVNSSSNYGIW